MLSVVVSMSVPGGQFLRRVKGFNVSPSRPDLQVKLPYNEALVVNTIELTSAIQETWSTIT